MYNYLGRSGNIYKFYLINKGKIVNLEINDLKYQNVKSGDYVIVNKNSKSPFRNSLNYKIGDIIYINGAKDKTYSSEGVNYRKATQFEYDKYEFINFKNFSGNAKVYQYLLDMI